MSVLGSISEVIYRAWAYLTTGRTLAFVLGTGFALLAIVLLIASRSRWGQAKPLTKCVFLSILAHVWLLMYAYGTRVILPQGDPRGRENVMSVSIDNFIEETPAIPSLDDSPVDTSLTAETPTWEQPVAARELPKPELPSPSFEQMMQAVSAPQLLTAFEPTALPELPAEQLPAAQQELTATPEQAPVIESPVLPPALPKQLNAAEIARVAVQSPVLPPEQPPPTADRVPVEYQLRQAQNRLQLAMPYGADADTEAAVEAGLKWLVQSQSPDGSWNAKRFGGGTETRALGEHRHGTGERADTGVSGLALLAFLSAGHTHLDGEHRGTVSRGLSFLMQSQMPSADLSGPKQIGQDPGVLNAKMYCHGIATLALAEAFAMTHDKQLENALIKAAQFTINAQDRRGGGWRYRGGDPGDLSLFGWQAMGLRSIDRSGIKVPLEVTRPMQQFLESCSAGSFGGLARYRPNEGRPSETMTAESLACRLLMGYPLSDEGRREAKGMILSHLPGSEQDNVYFWYYATLALFQLQDTDWRTWNQALKKRLLETQIPAYRDEAGSWDPDPIWGGYGGRVYSTAMSCLCLEVYYRYLPLYQNSSTASNLSVGPVRRTR